MKKNTFEGKTEKELKDSLAKEKSAIRIYNSSSTKKTSLKNYRESRKNVARILTALNKMDK